MNVTTTRSQGQSERKISRAGSYAWAPLSESPVHQRCVLSHTREMHSLQNATLLTFQDEPRHSLANTLEETGKCAWTPLQSRQSTNGVSSVARVWCTARAGTSKENSRSSRQPFSLDSRFWWTLACRRTIWHTVLLHHTSVAQQSTRSMHRKRNSCRLAFWWITFNLRELDSLDTSNSVAAATVVDGNQLQIPQCKKNNLEALRVLSGVAHRAHSGELYRPPRHFLSSAWGSRVDLVVKVIFFNILMWSKVLMLKMPMEETKKSISDVTVSMAIFLSRWAKHFTPTRSLSAYCRKVLFLLR